MNTQLIKNKRYFSIRRDSETVTIGGFVCQGCLVGKPISEQSPDSRYCEDCYKFLLNEAKFILGSKRPKWLPKASRGSVACKEALEK